MEAIYGALIRLTALSAAYSLMEFLLSEGKLLKGVRMLMGLLVVMAMLDWVRSLFTLLIP